MSLSIRSLVCALVLAAPAAQAHTISALVPLDGGLAGSGSTGTGSALVFYDADNNLLTVSVTTSGLLGVPTTCHLHRKADGGVAVGLDPTGVPGSWAIATGLSAPQLNDFLHQGWFVKVHTTAFPAGELSGDVILPDRFRSHAIGGEVVPPSGSGAEAWADISLNPFTGQLTYDVQTTGLVGTAAELRIGDAGFNGPLALTLTGGPTQWSGTTGPLTDSILANLQGGDLYLTIKSDAFPNGELRDQVWDGYLNADRDELSASVGGQVRYRLYAGTEYAGHLYWLLGSFAGDSPGVSGLGLTLPLNPDAWTTLTLANPNLAPYANTLGVFNLAGLTFAEFTLPSGLVPELAGATLHHAYVLFDGGGNAVLASNSRALSFIP